MLKGFYIKDILLVYYMNHTLRKFGSTDPDKVLNLIDLDDPDYLTIAFKYKKYGRIYKKDLKDRVDKLKIRNFNLHNMYIRVLNKNNTEIDEILKYLDDHMDIE
jgi:succinate dehydrogenase flavin-adding protein (antitoxin of CptAB toxin-antitoxin module)